MDTPQNNPDLKPRVDPHRRTTKVNIGVVIGVILFLVAAFAVVAFINRHPERTTEEMNAEHSNP